MQINRLFTSIQGILIIALVLRLVAALFSIGYAFHDDHFDVLRVAEAWTEEVGHYINRSEPPKHSMLYAGITAVFLKMIKVAGVSDPILKALFLQLIHGLYSLLIVYLGYLITDRISNRKNALRVALILSVLWFMPYLGVKFMAEIVCLPPLMYAFYLFLKEENQGIGKWLIIGLMIGLSFSVRMHIVLIAGGLGLVLLYQRKFKAIILIVLSFIVTTLVIIGIPDMLFFSYPFEYVVNYFAYNSENANEYVSGGYFKYLGTTAGFLVPPVSLMLLWGYGRSFKINPEMFLGVLLFFIVHSIFPNKQERFILPMFPFLIILGLIGWESFREGSSFWQRKSHLLKGFWVFFWSINLLAGFFMSLNYTKKDRIAPLHFLGKQENISTVLLEGRQGGLKQPPAFYLGEPSLDYSHLDLDFMGLQHYSDDPASLPKEVRLIYTIDRNKSLDSLWQEFDRMNRMPQYVAFYRADSLDQRMTDLLLRMPDTELEYLQTIEPSMLDKLLNFFNPRIHKRNTVQVYRIRKRD